MNRLRLGLALLLAGVATPVLAESKPALDVRVDRVERELRAVQRKVFPGGAPAYSEPEIAPAAPQAAAGVPASAPLNDLTARVNDLERSVSQLTGRVEEAEHRLQIVSEQAARDRQEFDTRLKTLEAGAAPTTAAPASAPAPFVDTGPAPARPAKGTKTPARTAPTMAQPAPDDAAAADAATPSTGDPAEDAYMAGYKLWSQKKYAEAETTLKGVVAKYPKSRRASYAQNLLGRAYLDDGQPARAAEAFAANYQTNPRGERAPDSLYYLGQSLFQLKKNSDACRVYDELDSAYGATLSDALRTRVATARRDARCKAAG